MDGVILHEYMSELMQKIISKIKITDVSQMLTRRELRMSAPVCSTIFCQGAFYFKNLSKKYNGFCQWREAYRKVGDVRIDFGFDAWEATSSSSKCDRMAGRKVSNVIGQVETQEELGERLSIRISCLAAGSWFKPIEGRSATPFSRSYDIEETPADYSEIL